MIGRISLGTFKYKSLLIIALLTLVSCARVEVSRQQKQVSGHQPSAKVEPSPEMEIALPAGLAVVSGRVTEVDSGIPVDGVPIIINGKIYARTNPDGTYLVKEAPVGMCSVGARDKDWYLVPHREGAISAYYNYVQYPRVYLEPEKVTCLDMQVAKGAKIRGLVQEASGAPVANTYIWITNQQETNSIVAAETGALGQYISYGVAPNIPLEFLVWTSDGRGSARHTLTLKPGDIREVNFTLDRERDYRITGTVCDSLGRRIQNVPLRCWWRAGNNRYVWDAQTNETGEYCFSGLEPDTIYEVYAYGQSVGYTTINKTVTVTPDTNKTELDFVLTKPVRPD